jgi:hypothetical protein
MGHIVPGPSKIKIPPLSQQSSSDADISARVLEKFGFLCAFVYAVWLNFIDPIYGYLAGDGSLPVGVGARPSHLIGENGLVVDVVTKVTAVRTRLEPSREARVRCPRLQ